MVAFLLRLSIFIPGGQNLNSVLEYVQRIESNIKEIAASVNEHAHMKSIRNIYILGVVALDETNILCKINLAIVLYGRAHTQPISNFIYCHEASDKNFH